MITTCLGGRHRATAEAWTRAWKQVVVKTALVNKRCKGCIFVRYCAHVHHPEPGLEAKVAAQRNQLVKGKPIRKKFFFLLSFEALHMAFAGVMVHMYRRGICRRLDLSALKLCTWHLLESWCICTGETFADT
eukprot:1161889-Pelagomonas_calceolata.AAC.4